MIKKDVFSLHYLPCLAWMQHFLQADQPIIDVNEHYVKQSYRNRCHILSANGVLALSIPVKKLSTKTEVNDMLIENEFNWQRQHWESIVSAYNSSPYFFYYRDYFEPLYHTKYETLTHWNTELLKTVLRLLKVNKTIQLSDAYIEKDSLQTDWREVIHPKKLITTATPSYIQVFADRFAFVSNCSIIDLMFNKGPESTDLLMPLKA
ncbi:MAG: WbqC family protein [Bacteroidota bacterium]|jgi:hypothetical protein